MTTMKTKPGLILIASGQNWPNIFSVMYYKAMAGNGDEIDLKRILIYASKKMGEPAERLKTAIERITQQEPQIIPAVGDRSDSPEAFQKFLDERSKDGPWIVNATGGLKVFSFHISCSLRNSWVHRVVYRSEAGTWLGVRMEDEKAVFDDLRHMLAEEKAFSLPLKDLIAIQTGVASPDYSCRKPGDPSVPDGDEFPDAETDLPSLLEKLIEKKWHWGEAFRSLYKKESRDGPAFEWFVFQTVRYLIGDTRAHLGIAPDGGGPEGEADVVAITGDQLILIDCKTFDRENSITTQILEARGKANRWGGSYAKAILVRPERSFDDGQKKYAEMGRVTLIGREEMTGWFSTMKKQLGSNVDVAHLDEKITNDENFLNRGRNTDRVVDRSEFKGGKINVYSEIRQAAYDPARTIFGAEARVWPQHKRWEELQQALEPRCVIFPWGFEALIPRNEGGKRPSPPFQGASVSTTAGSWKVTGSLGKAGAWAKTKGMTVKDALEEWLDEVRPRATTPAGPA